MMKQINYTITTVLLLLLFNTVAMAKEIVITTPGRQTIPLAHAPILAISAEDGALAQTFHDVLQGDLDLSGLFEFVAEGAFLDDAQNDDLNSTDINFAQWRMLGAQVLLKGTYKLRRNKLELKIRLYDVMTRRLLRKYSPVSSARSTPVSLLLVIEPAIKSCICVNQMATIVSA